MTTQFSCTYLSNDVKTKMSNMRCPADFHGTKVPLKIKSPSVLQVITCTSGGACLEWLEAHSELACL